jgi:NAD(P)-dependent dehydrogenase (short-subunit alcohol dehydrogenase family)
MAHKTSDISDPVVLVLDAGTDTGCRIARKLLSDGRRVAISDRHPAELTRIMHGYPSSQVLAIAADTEDPAQLGRLFAHVCDYFGADRLYTVASPTTDGVNVAATHLAMSA